MSIRSSRVAMRPYRRVLGQPSDMLVHSTKVHGGVGWGSLAFTINLEGGRVHHLQAKIDPEGFKGCDLSARCAAHTPGLLQNPRAPMTASVRSLSHVIVAARG